MYKKYIQTGTSLTAAAMLFFGCKSPQMEVPNTCFANVSSQRGGGENSCNFQLTSGNKITFVNLKNGSFLLRILPNGVPILLNETVNHENNNVDTSEVYPNGYLDGSISQQEWKDFSDAVGSMNLVQDVNNPDIYYYEVANGQTVFYWEGVEDGIVTQHISAALTDTQTLATNP